LAEGTLVFSTDHTDGLEIEAREARIRPAENKRTVAQVSVAGPKKLHIYARRAAVSLSYRGESRTIAEGESFEVIPDPAEDSTKKKQKTQKSGQLPRAFLLVAIGAGAGAAAAIVYEEHKHKQIESPDHP
jgi:chemotaxis response regulator CheB